MSMIGRHRSFVLALCIALAPSVLALVVLWQRPGDRGFTGLAVTVPSCPVDAAGCRVVITRMSDGTVAADGAWSGGPTSLSIRLPAGRYAVFAEGCTGYRIEQRAISVASGLHVALDMGVSWEMPSYLGRTCPGFIPKPVG